jgi:hypothetical protein
MPMDLTSLQPFSLPSPYLPPAFIGLKVHKAQGPQFLEGDVLVVQRGQMPEEDQWGVVSLDGTMALARLRPSQGYYGVTLPQGGQLMVPLNQVHVEGTLVGKFRTL